MAAFDVNIGETNELGGNFVYNALTRSFIKVSSVAENVSLNEVDIDCFRGVLDEALRKDPQSVTILPTTNCNARCWYCYEHGIRRYDMTIETAEKAASFIKNKFTEPELAINWFGGEPLLGFDIIQHITTKLKEQGYCLSTCVTTNGSMLTEEMVEFFKKSYNKVNVNITVDGINESYAKIKRYTNVPQEIAFEKLIHNIKLLLNNNVFVLLRINFDKLKKAQNVYAYLDNVLGDFDKSCYHICYAPIWKKDSDIEQFKDDAFRYLQYIRDGMDINILANPYMDNILINSVANPKRLGHCVALSKNNIVINADGKLYRCHSLVCDEIYACGDVTSGVDNTALGYQLFEKEHEKHCGGCALLPLCSTQCRVRSILYGEETICNNTKTIVPEIAKMKLEEREKQKNK